jgi:hypothetical protein
MKIKIDIDRYDHETSYDGDGRYDDWDSKNEDGEWVKYEDLERLLEQLVSDKSLQKMKKFKCTVCSDRPCFLQTTEAEWSPDICPWASGRKVTWEPVTEKEEELALCNRCQPYHKCTQGFAGKCRSIPCMLAQHQ